MIHSGSFRIMSRNSDSLKRLDKFSIFSFQGLLLLSLHGCFILYLISVHSITNLFVFIVVFCNSMMHTFFPVRTKLIKVKPLTRGGGNSVRTIRDKGGRKTVVVHHYRDFSSTKAIFVNSIKTSCRHRKPAHQNYFPHHKTLSCMFADL